MRDGAPQVVDRSTFQYSYPLLDSTVYGRQEPWEDSPTGWPQPWKDDEEVHPFRIDGRPIVQWPRVKAGHSDNL